MSLRIRTITLAAVAAAVAGTAAFAATDPIETRKATMKAIGGAFGGVLVKMLKGEIAYDPAAAKAAIATMTEKAASIDVATLFPKGSETGGDTSASPKIWSDTAGFKADLDKLRATLAAEGPKVEKGPDDLKAAVAAIGRVCKSCHDDYRIPKP